MQTHFTDVTSGLIPARPGTPQCIAPNESELTIRWGFPIKTLRRWWQERLDPVFCKLDARVTYLISGVEAFERCVSRHSTFTRTYQ